MEQGFSRSSPSWYDIKRINSKPAKKFVKLSIMVDTRRKKVLAARVRMLPAHDVRDIPPLLKHATLLPCTLVADKIYDSENVFEQRTERNVLALIPARRGVHRGFYRRKMR